MELDVHNVWGQQHCKREHNVGKQKARYWIGRWSGGGRRGWPVVGAKARQSNAAIRDDAGQ